MRNPDNDIAIKLTNISKQYTIHHEKPTLVEKFYKGKEEKFWALKNINLTIRKGERIGIFGPNGSGKTTLLKIIAGITSPTSGKVVTNGKIVSLIDLEAGFHPDLSGYRNIFLNGMLLGMKMAEIEKAVVHIIKFADIKQFIDAPLFTYSQGMKLRLGFSIAIHSKPDILILDEGLAVGDAEFSRKSKNKLLNMFKENKTILVVSHWMEFLKQRCNRIIELNNQIILHDRRI
jgi:ABC-type polysaccharide/polyol phosphate transport system ATPase subunit